MGGLSDDGFVCIAGGVDSNLDTRLGIQPSQPKQRSNCSSIVPNRVD